MGLIMPPISTGRRPKRSASAPMMNCPMPKPARKVESTACSSAVSAMWNADLMLGSAGSIMSMASGLRAMMEADLITNSAKPIGRWVEDYQASAFDIGH